MDIPRRPTSHEKLLAALSHSAILLLGAGAAVPLLVWNNQRGRSRYVTYQAVQALWWQSLLAVYFQVVLLIASLTFIGVNAVQGSTAQPSQALTFWLLGITALAVVIYVLVGLAGAVTCLLGHDFVYPFLGRPLERALLNGAEERLIAGTAHAGMFVPMLGMLVPLLAWVLPRPNTPFLRYHALQALIFQALSTVTAVLFSGILMVLSIPLVLAAVALWQNPNVSPALVIITLLLLLIVFLFAMLATLAVPIFGVFAFFAMIKVPLGKDYRYPIVGRLKWVTDNKI